ncbi:phosphatase PAP2 family protein [Nakamurella flavida]|uniref:Phosphatase PAP2 family protein n=1 Tax=Nakamurella flavida TaxID=363630 RepID=A0A938YBZ8_9ACTN|nr:phosphatase PAP2 family protein [Nakamurella flavida]MBM9474860.1 phosphatase PAP2 family protein [Nakamurella flavida]MDP9776430.1 undecaprenyl-diphosphatase [Nakamurella flavida]
MRTTDDTPDPRIVPAQTPVPQPLDIALRALTTAANHGVLWFGVAGVAAALGRRPRRGAIRGVMSLGASSLLANSVIKPVVGRRRPDPQRTHAARQIGRVPWTSSFPSGHSASAAAFATGLALEFPPAALVVAPLAAGVAYSRVHVGVHYPSDVVTGVGIGVAAALIGKWLWPVRPKGPAVMTTATAPALPDGRGLTVVLNEHSGSSGSARALIERELPGARFITLADGVDIAAELGPEVRALAVSGGDGTVASVARVALERGLPLAVFPSGTFNHFARAVGLEEAIDTVQAVREGRAGGVRVATANDEVFLNTASIGGYPEMVRRRDAYAKKIGKWPATALALRNTLRKHAPVTLDINGRVVKVWVAFVGNGRYTPRGLAPSWRERLDEPVLDVQYLRGDLPWSRTRAVLFSLIGIVERSAVCGSVAATSVTVGSRSGALPTAHDGEITPTTTSVDFDLLDATLTVYRG